MAAATPVARAIRGRCPRCGEGPLFTRFIVFQPRCPACGLDYAAFNVGDGAAAFLIFIVGAVVVGLAMWVELSFEPPWWVHVLLWLPLTVALTVGLLRIAKSILIAQEYSNDAREGRLE
jgi:uncharacterized protein (DUF983 family)